MSKGINAGGGFFGGGGDPDYSNIVTVGLSGAGFTDIQDAIDSITDATADNRYVIQIHPGEYTADNITLTDYIYLQGTETAAVYLNNKSLNTTAITFAPNVSGIFNMTLDVLYDNMTSSTNVLEIASGFQTISSIRVLASKTAGNYPWAALNITGGNISCNNFWPEFTTTDSSAGTAHFQNIISINGNNVTLKLSNCNIRGENNDSNDNLFGIGYPILKTGLDLRMLYSEMALDQNGDGLCGNFYMTGDTTDYRLFYNSFDIDTTGDGDSYGGYMDSTSAASEILSQGNIYQITTTGSGGTYGVNVGSGDTWDSRFDDVFADQYYTGAGTFNYVSILQDGTTELGTTLDVSLDSGVLKMAETTTPTAATNFGKVYTKSDNKLYFQDGGGTEHEISFV